jgi:hypothetical protein
MKSRTGHWILIGSSVVVILALACAGVWFEFTHYQRAYEHLTRGTIKADVLKRFGKPGRVSDCRFTSQSWDGDRKMQSQRHALSYSSISPTIPLSSGISRSIKMGGSYQKLICNRPERILCLINAYRTGGFWPTSTCPVTRLTRSWQGGTFPRKNLPKAGLYTPA